MHFDIANSLLAHSFNRKAGLVKHLLVFGSSSKVVQFFDDLDPQLVAQVVPFFFEVPQLFDLPVVLGTLSLEESEQVLSLADKVSRLLEVLLDAEVPQLLDAHD